MYPDTAHDASHGRVRFLTRIGTINYSDPFGLCPDPNKPWCSSPGYAILRFFGVSDATADKIGSIFYGGAMIAGAAGMGEGPHVGGSSCAPRMSCPIIVGFRTGLQRARERSAGYSAPRSILFTREHLRR